MDIFSMFIIIYIYYIEIYILFSLEKSGFPFSPRQYNTVHNKYIRSTGVVTINVRVKFILCGAFNIQLLL